MEQATRVLLDPTCCAFRLRLGLFDRDGHRGYLLKRLCLRVAAAAGDRELREISIMPELTPRPVRVGSPARWTAAYLISLVWLLVVVLAVRKMRQADAAVVALAALGAAAITFGIQAWFDRARWRDPLVTVTSFVRGLRQDRKMRLPVPPAPELLELTREIVALARSVRPSSQRPRRSLPDPVHPFNARRSVATPLA